MNPKNPFRLTGATAVAALVLAFLPAVSAEGPSTFVASGVQKLHDGDYDGSIADYSKALELNPNLPGAYLGRGSARRGQGNYDGAIADFAAALKLKPSLAEAYLGRGDAEFLQGNLDASIADFTKATELKPEYHQAYFQRGLARGCQTNLLGAYEDLIKAGDPKMTNSSLNDYAALYRNLFYMRMGNVPDELVQAKTGWSSEWTKTLAAFLTQQIHESDLLKYASDKAAGDKTVQGEAWYFAGVMKLNAGEKAAAKTDFQKSVDASSDSSVIHRLARSELDHS